MRRRHGRARRADRPRGARGAAAWRLARGTRRAATARRPWPPRCGSDTPHSSARRRSSPSHGTTP